MPNRAHIFTLWIWMTTLMASTMGICVQQIYCYCVGTTSYSIFRDTPDACAASKATETGKCCKKAAPSCCANKPENGDRDCTKKTVKVFQMKVDFLVGQALEKKLDCPVWADDLPEFLRLYRPVICVANLSNKAPTTLPPPLSGRLICLRHEVFRC